MAVLELAERAEQIALRVTHAQQRVGERPHTARFD
jgi:hypothetical protein